jgi:hypothetical protein
MVVITGSAFQLFGPLTNVQNNSMYYSGKYKLYIWIPYIMMGPF